MTTKAEQIRALNDDVRHRLPREFAVITPGVAALGQVAVDRIVQTIAVYDDFCHENDPHEEHDFGTRLTAMRCSSRSTTTTTPSPPIRRTQLTQLLLSA